MFCITKLCVIACLIIIQVMVSADGKSDIKAGLSAAVDNSGNFNDIV